MNPRRRMMMGIKRVYVFKEGEGILLGETYLSSTYNSEINKNYINLEGRAWGSGTEDDEAYGMLIAEKLVEDASFGFDEGGAFDFSNYKTLNFEFEGETNDKYGYVGYCKDQRINKFYLHHKGGFDEDRIKGLYNGGEYKTITGTERKTISFNISEKTSGIIAMLSPIGNRYIRFFNIWFE